MKNLKKIVLKDFKKMSKEELKSLKGGGNYSCWYCGGYANDYLDCMKKCGVID